MALSKLSSGGGFFKAKEHTDAEVILFEPKRFEAQVPGQFGERDLITADVTVWKDQGAEPTVLPAVRIDARALVRDLEPLVKGGEAVAARIVMLPPKKGTNDFPVLRAVDSKAEAVVEAYIEARDAALSDENVPF